MNYKKIIITLQNIVNSVVELMPKPRDAIDGTTGINGVDGKDGVDGNDVDEQKMVENLSVFIAGELKVELLNIRESIPTFKDGRDGKDGVDGINGIDGKDADEEAIKTNLLHTLNAEIHELSKDY